MKLLSRRNRSDEDSDRLRRRESSNRHDYGVDGLGLLIADTLQVGESLDLIVADDIIERVRQYLPKEDVEQLSVDDSQNSS